MCYSKYALESEIFRKEVDIEVQQMKYNFALKDAESEKRSLELCIENINWYNAELKVLRKSNDSERYYMMDEYTEARKKAYNEKRRIKRRLEKYEMQMSVSKSLLECFKRQVDSLKAELEELSA